MGARGPDPLYAARVKLEVQRRLFGGTAVLRVGRFEVGEPIGAGGMSVVYRARDPELDRRVALKVVQDTRHTERLSREARALARLRHPNVVGVYEVGRWNEHVFLALEHVEGRTLGAWRADPTRTQAEVVRVALAIADGLAAVHDAGLVHRDVKPENVVVDPTGAPRLVDFGLVTEDSTDGDGAALPVEASPSVHADAGAAGAAGTPSLTRPGATPGTPRYIAPERLAGEPASAASDQYSFGVMLDEVLAGLAPDASLAAIVRRARAERPVDRFPSMRELRDALARSLDPRTASRWRVPVLGALALASVVAVGVLASRERDASTAPTHDAPLDAAAANDPAGYADLSVGTHDAEARRQVRAGLLALRDGARNEAALGFDAAAQRDPHYGAAHFWRALLASHGDVNGARRSFEHAFAARAGMSATLRAMLDALVPCIQADPIDDATCETALDDASARMPASAHLAYELARHRMNRLGASDDVVRMFARALDADPGFVLALYGQGQALAYLGRFEEALVVTDACLRAVPGSDACIHDRAWIHTALGDDEGLASDARRLRAAMPANSLSYQYLAAVAIARFEPLPTVRELLRQASDRLPDALAGLTRPRDDLELAVLGGRFDEAGPAIEAMEAAVATDTDRATRLLGRRMRILVALETGHPDEAAQIAEEALAAMEAWAPDPRNEDFGIARDATPFLLDVLRDTGAITDDERAQRRDAWLADWRTRTAAFNEPFLWLAAYARTVDDAVEAEQALAAMPASGPPPFHPLTFGEAGVGRAYLLGGRASEALPYLRRAAASLHAVELTFGLENGWEAVRASRDLGRALEATGDREGACAAYQRVVDRWGDAAPRSVTADDARARRAALACD